MCPRAQLGYPIQPHRIMRALAARDTSAQDFSGAMYCSTCGLCEVIACPQSLAPRKMIRKFKSALAKGGVIPQKRDPALIPPTRNGKMVDATRLKIRLGLSKYDGGACI